MKTGSAVGASAGIETWQTTAFAISRWSSSRVAFASGVDRCTGSTGPERSLLASSTTKRIPAWPPPVSSLLQEEGILLLTGSRPRPNPEGSQQAAMTDGPPKANPALCCVREHARRRMWSAGQKSFGLRAGFRRHSSASSHLSKTVAQGWQALGKQSARWSSSGQSRHGPEQSRRPAIRRQGTCKWRLPISAGICLAARPSPSRFLSTASEPSAYHRENWCLVEATAVAGAPCAALPNVREETRSSRDPGVLGKRKGLLSHMRWRNSGRKSARVTRSTRSVSRSSRASCEILLLLLKAGAACGNPQGQVHIASGSLPVRGGTEPKHRRSRHRGQR